MHQSLDGKVAVITGGGRGLGRATALEMAARGARIVVADFFRNDNGVAAADEVVAEIEAAGGSAAASYADVSKEEDAQGIVEIALERFGRADIVCTYAGNFSNTSIDKLTAEEFAFTIGVHLFGTFNCIKAVLPSMMENKFGRIITVSSRAAFGGSVPAYATAKSAVMGLTAAVAGEMTRFDCGVTANCLLPSAYSQLFPTQDLHPPLLPGMPETEAETLDPADVAPLAAFLATERAGNITGRYFFAGGGDIVAFAQPFRLTNMNNFLRKTGRWSVEELTDVLYPILGA